MSWPLTATLMCRQLELSRPDTAIAQSVASQPSSDDPEESRQENGSVTSLVYLKVE